MGFQPVVLQPSPEPFFVRELKKIDPDLRVIWAYERYFLHCWVIERKISPERYAAMYASLLESGDERFVDQPILDTNQPTYDDEGNQSGYQVVGWRKFDLAPEWEWVMNVQNPDGSRRELDQRLLTELRRTYAWERNHSLTRLKFEREQAEQQRLTAQHAKHAEIGLEGVREAWREAGKTVQI